MNDVARTTQVALALGVIGRRRRSARIALIDLGGGAGLGLYPDRYRHLMGDGRSFGDARSQLTLRCESDGPLPPPVPSGLPSIESRIGVDVEPIDLTDRDDRRWARACLPPETRSLDRFDRAARLATAEPGWIRRGDAIEELPAILDVVADDVLPVVTDTYTAVFFSDEQRRRLHQLVRHWGAIRDLVWISLDPLVPLGSTADTASRVSRSPTRWWRSINAMEYSRCSAWSRSRTGIVAAMCSRALIPQVRA